MPLYEVEPYYRTGTATFDATNTVTFQGAGDLRSEVQPGDQIFNRLGQMAVIATVAAGWVTLVVPFAGTAQTAAAYTIYRVSDSVRLENFNQRMVNLLKGGVLSSLGGLDGTDGDKGLMLNGPGSAATFPLTAFARTLLDDTNQAGALATLGLLPVQSDKNDVATAAKLVRVDGAIAAALSQAGRTEYVGSGGGANIDTMAAGSVGLFHVNNAGTFPQPLVGQTFWWIETQRTWTGNARTQFAHAYQSSGVATPSLWYRAITDAGTWSSWRPILPDRTANANGLVVRYADGTQECTSPARTLTYAAANELNNTWTFPAAFASTDYLACDLYRSRVAGDYSGVGFNQLSAPAVSVGAASATLAFFNVSSTAWTSGASLSNCRAVAKGRWL